MIPFKQAKKILSEDEFLLYERSFWKDLSEQRAHEDLKRARKYRQKYISRTGNREDPRVVVFSEIAARLVLQLESAARGRLSILNRLVEKFVPSSTLTDQR